MKLFSSHGSKPAYLWSPSEDITTFELAQCMGVLVGVNMRYSSIEFISALIESLPENAKRHFQRTDSVAAA